LIIYITVHDYLTKFAIIDYWTNTKSKYENEGYHI